MANTIKIWKPLDNIGGKHWFENVSLINENFVFAYKKGQQKNIYIHVICGGGLTSFRYTNETYFGDFTLLDSPKDLGPWSFYTVQNSSYLKKLSQDSGGLSDHYNLKHYCIISIDEVVDIIYPAEPIVEIVVDNRVVASSDPEHRSLK